MSKSKDAWKPDGPPLWILQLAVPIRNPVGDLTTELPFWRRLKAKHLIQATKRGLTDEGEDRVCYYLSAVTNFNAEDLAEMDGADFGEASRVINAFLAAGPGTDIAKRVSGLSRPPSPESPQTS